HTWPVSRNPSHRFEIFLKSLKHELQ
ncbi:hypothetical protein CP061683_0588B, partial [Chlamydia psittaci 06-1683]